MDSMKLQPLLIQLIHLIIYNQKTAYDQKEKEDHHSLEQEQKQEQQEQEQDEKQ